MATADKLLDQVLSWIEKRECCAKQLRKLAQELESLREKCTASKCVGNSVAVVGTACLIGAGLATLLTGGAAAPLVGLGAMYTGAGTAISLTTTIAESFLSSDTMKEAQKIDKESNEIAERIQQLFKTLKDEMKNMNLKNPEELDQHIVTEILRAMARRSGLKINFNYCNDMPEFFQSGGQTFTRSFSPDTMTSGFILTSSIALFFAMEFGLKRSKSHFYKGAQQLVKVTAKGAALKGGAMVAGGVVGMMFTLPKAIDNWKEMIKNNHVTEASRSLRDAADTIQKMTQKLREQLNNAEEALQEMAEKQRKDKEELSRNRNTQQDHTNNSMSSNLTQREISKCLRSMVSSSKKKGTTDSQGHKRHKHTQEDRHTKESNSNRKRDKNAQCGGGCGGGSDQEGGGNRGDKECGGADEESDDDSDKDEGDEATQNGPATLSIIVANVRSANNKIYRLCDLMTENNPDIFLPTETWLNCDNANEILSEISPPNYSFFHQARDGGRGGGVAILFSSALQGVEIRFDFIKTFEYVAAVLQHNEWDEPVLFINVYRTNSNEHFETFLHEFHRLLIETQWYSSIIVTGDFNIWVDDESLSSTSRFNVVLEVAGFVQHVTEPTHQRGHTLDLVITRNVEISNVIIRNDNISDHYPVYFSGRPALKLKKKKTKAEKDQDEQDKQLRKNEE